MLFSIKWLLVQKLKVMPVEIVIVGWLVTHKNKTLSYWKKWAVKFKFKDVIDFFDDIGDPDIKYHLRNAA